MNRFIIIFLLAVSGLSLQGQDTLRLGDCMEAARRNAPRYRDSELIRNSGELKMENAATNWLPSLNLNGKASWQSDVVELSIENAVIPIEFPTVPKDQYSVSLDVRQMIYDGGLTKKLKAYELSSMNVDLQQMEVDLFLFKDQVNQLFFSILLLQENRKNLELALANLKEQEKVVESAVKNGVSTANDRAVLQVEILKLLQSLDEIDTRRLSLFESLSILTGNPIDPEAIVELPYLEPGDTIVPERPELELFQLQQKLIDATVDMKKTERLPKVYAFGQAGYGRPGYNMLSSTFDTYYMAGIMLQWNIWDWKKNSRDQQVLEQRKQMLVNAEDQYTRQLQLLTMKEEKLVEQYRKAMDLDGHILELQSGITANAAAQLENGTINSASYIQELNKDKQARARLTLHKMQLLQSLSNIMILNGKL